MNYKEAQNSYENSQFDNVVRNDWRARKKPNFGQWRQNQENAENMEEVIPLTTPRPETTETVEQTLVPRTLLEVYRPTLREDRDNIEHEESNFRPRWRQTRLRPQRPGANALLTYSSTGKPPKKEYIETDRYRNIVGLQKRTHNEEKPKGWHGPESDQSVRRVAFRARFKDSIDHRIELELKFSCDRGTSARMHRGLDLEQEKELGGFKSWHGPESDQSVRRVAFRVRFEDPIDQRIELELKFSYDRGASARMYRGLDLEQEKELGRF
ncbi:unnamed protein product [Spodoptera exigua]|nr:unnamed protein product [Spodoptera exigua]